MNKKLKARIEEHLGCEAAVPENMKLLFRQISNDLDEINMPLPSSPEALLLKNMELIEEKGKLEKAYKDLAGLFEDVEELVFTVDLIENRITKVSPACEKIYGYPAAYFYRDGNLWEKLIHPEDKHVADEGFRKLMQGKPAINEYRVIHRDGSTRWLEDKVRPILDEHGVLVRIDGVSSDITARKKIEHELEATCSLLEATIESTANGILVANKDGRIVRFNKKFAELWNIPEEILQSGEDSKALAHVIDQLSEPDVFIAKINWLYEHDSEISFDEIYFKDGRIMERYSLPQIINGKGTGRVWSYRDITERKRADAKLIESEFRYRSLIEQASDPICLLDAEMKFIEINDSGCSLFGYTRDELIGKSIGMLVFEEDLLTNPFKLDALKSGSITRNERRVKTKNGKIIEIELSARLMHDEKMLIIGRDITERKIAASLLAKSEEKYRTLFEQNVAGVYQSTRDGQLVDCNDAFVKILKYDSKEELMALNTQELYFCEKDRKDFIRDLANGENIPSYEGVLKCKDGTPLYFIENVSVGRDADTHEVFFNGILIDITAKKKSEIELKKINERYDLISKATTDMVWDWNLETDEIFRNAEGWKKIFRGDISKITDRVDDWKKRLHPDDRNRVNIIYESIGTSTQDFFEVECRVLRDDGTYAYIHDRGHIIRDAQGKGVRMLGATEDITLRKEVELQLAKSELRYRSLVQNSTDLTTILSPTGEYLYTSPALKSILGYEPDEITGRNIFSFLHKDDADSLKQNLLKTQEKNIEKIILLRIQHANKEWRWLESSITDMTTYAEVQGFICNSRDVTERKQSEEALIKRESQFSIAAKMAKLAYWELDLISGNFIFNDQFYDMFKTNVATIGSYNISPQRYMELFVYPEDIEFVQAEIATALDSKESDVHNSMHHRIIYGDGTIGWVSVFCQLKKSDKGKNLKAFGINQDITESKKSAEILMQSEANLALKNKQLEVKNNELEQFAFVASHDLQEPLRTTAGFVNLLQKEYSGQLNEKATKSLTYIADATNRMQVLIKDLLEFASIGNNAELTEVDCNTVIQNIRMDLRAAILESDARIDSDNLPIISGYPTEIHLLFQNLVMNSIKFRKAGVSPQIKIAAQKTNGFWQFSVSDNGIGISEKYNSRIFDIFQRLHNRKEFAGSGIGLSHCKKIVEIHGGKIWVDSEFGKGATFTFTIRAMAWPSN